MPWVFLGKFAPTEKYTSPQSSPSVRYKSLLYVKNKMCTIYADICRQKCTICTCAFMNVKNVCPEEPVPYCDANNM